MASWKVLGLKPDTEGDKSRTFIGIISQVNRQGEGGRRSGRRPLFISEGFVQRSRRESRLRGCANKR